MTRFESFMHIETARAERQMHALVDVLTPPVGKGDLAWFEYGVIVAGIICACIIVYHVIRASYGKRE